MSKTRKSKNYAPYVPNCVRCNVATGAMTLFTGGDATDAEDVFKGLAEFATCAEHRESFMETTGFDLWG